MKRNRRGRPTPSQPWTDFRETEVTVGKRDDERMFVNSKYLVSVTMGDPERGMAGPLHLSIHDHARSTRHDWRDFQRIKNEIAGPQREAIELYPADSRLLDTSNEYHLWVMPEGEEVPVGFTERTVTDAGTDSLATREEYIAAMLGHGYTEEQAARGWRHRHRSKQRRIT